MEVSEAKRLKALEDENGKLERLLAEAMLDDAGLKDLLAEKGGAADRLGRADRALAGGLRPWPARGWPALPGRRRRRRCHQGVPRGGGGHVDLRAPGGAGADGPG
jgi:hypothetical protein